MVAMDEIEFPIEDVPKDLHNVILEKMSYPVFKNFNKCSNSSADLCENLSPNVKLHADVFRVDISEQSFVYLTRMFQTINKSILTDTIPFNLMFNVTQQEIDISEIGRICNFFKKHGLKAKKLNVVGPITNDELPFIQFLLKATRPKEWTSRNITKSEAFFGFPEVQNLDCISCVPESLSDKMLLNLRAPKISLFEPFCQLSINHITDTGFDRFLMQWVRRDRKISDLDLSRRLTLDLDLVLRRIEETTSDVKILRALDRYHSETGRYWFCRKEEKHEECLRIDKEDVCLRILACESNWLCPGIGLSLLEKRTIS